MEENKREIDISLLFKALISNWRKVIKWTAVGACIGLVIAFSIPKEYECTVILAPENKTSQSSLGGAGGLASMLGVNLSAGSSQSGITQGVYPDIIKSSPFLSEFSNLKVDVDGTAMTLRHYLTKEQKRAWWKYVTGFPSKLIGWVMGSDQSKAKGGGGRDSVFYPSAKQVAFEQSLSRRIECEVQKKTNLITLTITMQDPVVCALVADSLIVEIKEYVVDYQTSKVRADLQGNILAFEEAREKYYEAEQRYAEAKDQNRNLIINSMIIKLDRLSNDKKIAYSVYEQLASQVEVNKIKLREETPVVTVIEPARVPTQAASPNKLSLMMIYAFFGGFASTTAVLLKQIFGKQK